MHLNIFCNQNALYARAINKKELVYALGQEVPKLASVCPIILIDSCPYSDILHLSCKYLIGAQVTLGDLAFGLNNTLNDHRLSCQFWDYSLAMLKFFH